MRMKPFVADCVNEYDLLGAQPEVYELRALFIVSSKCVNLITVILCHDTLQ